MPAIWGEHNPCLIPPGAETYLGDISNASVRFPDTGQFALETHVEEVAPAMRRFWAESGYQGGLAGVTTSGPARRVRQIT
ncbi:MAG TPA: hypothetical protein VML19_07815 [Verrucomicrobiae bacterium]|nr:hypothetical protein [Verrucomicrobiae bacterium]